MKLQKFCFLLFVIFYFVPKVESYATVNCSLTNITTFLLNANDTAFLQTPNFPQTISTRCQAKIITTDTNNVWIAMLNGAADLLLVGTKNSTSSYDYYTSFISNDDDLTYVTTSNTLNFTAKPLSSGKTGDWSAVQSAVVSFQPSLMNYTCPMSGQAFDFSLNSDLVIPISSSFYNPDSTGINRKSCNWVFTTDSTSQMLKVVIRSLYFPDNNFWLSFNFDNGVAFKNFTKKYYGNDVFYYNASIANLTFSNYGSSGSFFILVSAVENEPEYYTSNGCQHLTNANYTIGYPSYQSCTDTLKIYYNYESTLTLTEANYEKCCDHLSLVSDKYGSIDFNSYDVSTSFTLTSKMGVLNLTFNSDGNTQQSGYKMTIETYRCECADPFVVMDCNYSRRIRPMQYTDNYCGNMTCDYKISSNQSCPDNYYYVTFNKYSNTDSNLTLSYNENSTKITRNFEGYFSPQTQLKLQFSSNVSSNSITQGRKSWHGSAKPFSPNFIKINLNKTNTKYLLWLADMKHNDAVTVCATEGILEAYVSRFTYDYDSALSHYRLFEGDERSAILLGSLNYVPSPLPSQSSTGCFTVYFPVADIDQNHMVLFKIADGDSKVNCGLNSTVYQVTGSAFYYDTTDNTYNIQSSSSGSCEINFLAGLFDENHDDSDNIPEIWIKNITINSPTTVSLLSISNNKLLLQLNTSEAKQWEYFGIYTSALTVIIPPSTQVAFTLYSNRDRTIKNSNNTIQKGLMTSPSSNGFQSNFNSTILYQFQRDFFYYSPLYQMTLSFKERYGNPNVILNVDGKNVSLTNDKTTIQLRNFSLIYEEKNSLNDGFLIEYIIDKNEITTTTIPQTSTSPKQPIYSTIATSSSMSYSLKIEVLLFTILFVHFFNH